ncbi:MAG: M48 family metallopeptidase [Clostridiales Family XIII bacterium]|nr:M48 family metallopeptidase [Clostridiales Family XIII bacterium]
MNNNKQIEYKLIRSRRKTLSLRVTKEAAVEVRAPLRMAAGEIDRFVSSKRDWLEANIERVSRDMEQRSVFLLDYGGSVTMLGSEYTIKAKQGNNIGYDDSCIFIPPGLSGDEIKLAIIALYKHTAKVHIGTRINEFAAIMGVSPASVRINSAKTRWGSCSGKDNINFSWRLIVAAPEIVDYVIVHELAHIKSHDHSPRFWAHVENVIPEYKSLRKQLKSVNEALNKQEWD